MTVSIKISIISSQLVIRIRSLIKTISLSVSGVVDSYPDFATWTGAKRLREAKTVGAEAIPSACPWCTWNFLESAKRTRDKIEVLESENN